MEINKTKHTKQFSKYFHANRLDLSHFTLATHHSDDIFCFRHHIHLPFKISFLGLPRPTDNPVTKHTNLIRHRDNIFKQYSAPSHRVVAFCWCRLSQSLLQIASRYSASSSETNSIHRFSSIASVWLSWKHLYLHRITAHCSLSTLWTTYLLLLCPVTLGLPHPMGT